MLSPLEVIIQDNFFCPDGFSQASAPVIGEPVVTEALWQQWFQTWFAHLQPQFGHPPFLPPLATASNAGYELGLRLTDDAEIQGLNLHYRQIDTPTDVLAFAALEAELENQPMQISDAADVGAEPLYLGDIVISVDTAQRQAQRLNHDLSTELAWLSAHGFLHLLGWDHADAAQLQQMLAQQAQLLGCIDIAVLIDQYLAEYSDDYGDGQDSE
jgi:probable rRNA maturation factor